VFYGNWKIEKELLMKQLLALLLSLALAIPSVASTTLTLQEPAKNQTPGATPLTNKDILELNKSGVASEIIVAKIKSSPSTFDTTPAALTELKTAGVPDAVVLAMVEKTDSSNVAAAPIVGVETSVKVSDGTEIEIQLKNTLSGQTAKVGDMVDFTVVRPVLVNGVTIFEKDASARARVTTAKGAGHWGKAGKLEWAMQDVQAVDGNRVPTRFTKRETGDSKGGTVAVAAVATTVLLGPLGLLWGLKKGKPAIIPAGNRYSVFVHGDTTVKTGKP
jgi:hypothetical protein